MPSHPRSRFVAPPSIQAGSSLADLLDGTAIGLIGESFAVSTPGFDLTQFVADATSAARDLSLKSRAVAIAKVLREALPPDDHAALACLRRSWGPELTRTHDNGLSGLFYMPHSALLGEFGGTGDDVLFSAALDANFELTTRFTAEFSIRPFLHARLAQTLQRLGQRVDDPNPHIRRLISEGTRPRLPWATHLQAVRTDPTLTLPLLTALRDDADRYVTRSVANHLGDLGKDHPDLLLETCRAWLDELGGLSGAAAKERRWLIRHAL
ncbi:MAG: hypothetical protein VB934_11570, partial [Polyangiaceae bacterium]